MATTISTQDIVDAKRDIEDIGKAVNEKVIVSPRYGEDFKSLPMIAEEFQISSDAAEAAAASAAESASIAQSSANIAEAAATAATIGAGVFETPEAGVDPETGVSNGAYYNVRSSSDESYIDEYQNVGGVPTPSGKSYPSSEYVRSIKEAIIDTETGDAVASKLKDESGLNQQQLNNQRPTVLQLADIAGNGVINDSVEIQKVFRSVDDNRKSYIFFPLYRNNYLIDSPVVLQEPAMIDGDAAATYNRGIGKDGKIIVGANAEYAFNLGNGRSFSNTTQDVDSKLSKNPADQWTVKNIAFAQQDGVEWGTKIGMVHDSKTNGPDRGFIMREVSGTGMLHVIKGIDNNVQTHLATMVVENCCLSNNMLPINMEGNVFGARIVGNQLEQNSIGAIHGVFHAGLTIHDNMLEGGGNTIYIKDHPQDRDGCYLSLERNYFEACYGDYLVKMESFSGNEIRVSGNYVSGFLKDDGVTPNSDHRNQPTDLFLLKNTYNTIQIHDALSCTFFDWAVVASDNNIKKCLVYASPSSELTIHSEFNSLPMASQNNIELNSIAYPIPTNLGNVYMLGYTDGGYMNIPQILKPNKTYQVSLAYYSDYSQSNTGEMIIAESGGGVVKQSSLYFAKSDSELKTVNFVFTTDDTVLGSGSLMISIKSTDTDLAKRCYFVGAAAQEIGSYNASAVNNTDNRFIVKLMQPKIYLEKDGLSKTVTLQEVNLPANGGMVYFDYVVEGLSRLQNVSAFLNSFADITISAAVLSASTLRVYLKNDTNAIITIPSGTKLKYVVKP